MSKESENVANMCQNEAKMQPKWLSGTSWAPFLPCLSSKTEIKQKSAKNDPPNGRFGELFWPYVRYVGVHMEDQMTKKRVQKASMVGSAHILKLANTFEFLSFFEGLGSQVELRMEALRGSGEQLGAH